MGRMLRVASFRVLRPLAHPSPGADGCSQRPGIDSLILFLCVMLSCSLMRTLGGKVHRDGDPQTEKANSKPTPHESGTTTHSSTRSVGGAFLFLLGRRVSKNTSARTVARTFKESQAINSDVQTVLSWRTCRTIRRVIIISWTSVIPSVPPVERDSKMQRPYLPRR